MVHTCRMRRFSLFPIPASCRRRSAHAAGGCVQTAQAGASIIEFSIAAVLILLLGLGGMEVAQWFFSKQAVSLALLEAGRAAITAHAKPSAIETAFEQALLPLFPATESHSARQRLDNALGRRSQTTGAAPWRIEVLSPSPQAFLDFSDPALAIARQTGRRAINNNYLAEQDQHKRAQGWINGRGPQSGLSILQANTVVLRLTYLHEPILPGMKSLMRLLGAQGGSYGQRAMALGGYLPLVQEISLVMQSHPVDWPLPNHGKVVGFQAPSGAISLPTAGCQGLWCLDSQPASASPGSTPPVAGSNEGGSAGAGSNQSLPQWPTGQPSGPSAPGNDSGAAGSGELTVKPDDPACGLTLCCVAA